MSSRKTTDALEKADVELPVIDFAKRNGWFYVRKVKWIGKVGAPDRLFVKNGRHIWVEFKAPGGPLRPTQEREHRRMRRHGMEVYVIDNPEDGYALFA